LHEHLQLSIIIVNHRSEAILDQCVNAINKSVHSLSFEIIIVDNPPGKDIDHKIDIDDSLLQRISTSRRIGFAAACNYGASYAEGDFLLFLNPDVILEKKAIFYLHAALMDNKDAGTTVGRLTGPDGEFQPSCRRFPTLGNLLQSRGSILYRFAARGEAIYTLPDYSQITPVESAAAAMMMISKDRFDSLSGFDEDYYLYMEDTDLCFRLARLDYKTLYVPRATGVHLWGYSTRHYRFRRIIWHHRSLWRFFIRHRRSLVILAGLIPLLSINCLLSLCVELLTIQK
jgi:GT2 family glycosyltransferase